MRRHRISDGDVESCLAEPEWLEVSVQGRMNAWRNIRGKFLRVTYTKEADQIVVITAVFKKRAPKK